jgi:isopenicillin N synthase-like dioxygenase
VVTEAELMHSSFVDLFRYDCSGEILENAPEHCLHVACPEHRDTGVLTLIPSPKGQAVGFECYDWSAQAWRSIEVPEDEAIVCAGELFPFVTGLDVPALTHRVVIPVSPSGNARCSMPFELLPTPTADVAAEVCRLGQGLMSANH